MKEDRRIAHSKERIRTSLAECLQTTSLDKISVKEICEKADINRSTFYAHYTDIFTLYNEVKKEYFIPLEEQAQRLLMHEWNYKKYLVETNRYMEQNRMITLALYRADREAFLEKVNEIAGNQELWRGTGLEVSFEYKKEFVLTGLLSVVMKWLRKERRESPEELAETIYVLTKTALKPGKGVHA